MEEFDVKQREAREREAGTHAEDAQRNAAQNIFARSVGNLVSLVVKTMGNLAYPLLEVMEEWWRRSSVNRHQIFQAGTGRSVPLPSIVLKDANALLEGRSDKAVPSRNLSICP